MSGGKFEYKQYYINQIADDIESELNRQGKLKPKESLWFDKDYYEKYPEEKYYQSYPDDVAKKMKEGLIILRKASLYAQRIDWLLSGDDGNETFIERLDEELNDLNKKYNLNN